MAELCFFIPHYIRQRDNSLKVWHKDLGWKDATGWSCLNQNLQQVKNGGVYLKGMRLLDNVFPVLHILKWLWA